MSFSSVGHVRPLGGGAVHVSDEHAGSALDHGCPVGTT